MIRDRQRRVIKPPQRYGQADLVTFAFTVNEKLIYLEPRNYKETLDSK